MNLSPFVFVFLWLAAMAVLIGWSWWRKWHRQYAAARHTYRAAAEDVEAATVFYGSMNRDDELAMIHRARMEAEPDYRDWATATRALHHELPLDWHERTRVELAPEALDVDDAIEQACESDRMAVAIEMGWLPAPPDDPGPGVASSPDPPPGPVPLTSPVSLAPVHERLAGIGDIHEAHQSHPHPEDGWLDAQLADLYDWVRAQLEAAA